MKDNFQGLAGRNPGPHPKGVTVPNMVGLFSALLLSLGFACMAFKLAVRAYRKIG
jgi:hypothetical protein